MLDCPYARCPSPFLEQLNAPLGGLFNHVRVHTAFKSKACIGAEGVTFGRFSDGHGMKPGGFEQDLGRLVVNSTGFTTIDTGQAHASFHIGNDQILFVQGAIDTIERGEMFTGQGFSNHDLAPADARQVEGVQGVSKFVEYDIGCIHNVVDGLQTQCSELSLNWLWTRSDLDVVKLDSQVMGAI